MRYAVELEAIGDVYDRQIREFDRFCGGGGKGLRSPWIARLMSYDAVGGFDRQFVNGRKDYSRSNSKGSRGIYLCYALDPGVYEINELASWSSSRRYFCMIDGESLHEITKEEAIDVLLKTSSRHQRP